MRTLLRTNKFHVTFSRLAGDVDEPSAVRTYDDILAEIRERAPFAEIVVVNYPPVFTESNDSSGAERCPGFLKSGQQWINQQLGEATGLMAEAAVTVDAVMVDLTEEFDGHGLCQPEPWFMDLSGEGPLHPNADGHAAIAEAVHKRLN